MAVISFRRPEEGLDYYKHVLDLFTIFADVARNPDAGKHIAELSQQVNAALTLTEEKKKELAEAQEIMTQAHDFSEDLNKREVAHGEKVKSDLRALEEKRKEREDQIHSWESEKKTLLGQVAKDKADALTKLSESQARVLRAQEIEKSADAKLKAVKEKELAHAVEVEKLAKLKEEHDAALKAAYEQHQAKVAKLEQDRKEFEEYKNNLMSMLTKGK